ncbi:GxxExxY protein [bacterium]|nr:GxxExxY protein [bacterium]
MSTQSFETQSIPRPQRSQRFLRAYGENYPLSEFTEKIIKCSIEVHSNLGPGLLEKLYEEALIHEFELQNISFERQKIIKFFYKNKEIGNHKLDCVVEDKVILELKAVDELNKIHKAQLLTYLRAMNKPVGLLINFNHERLKDGLKRIVNTVV